MSPAIDDFINDERGKSLGSLGNDDTATAFIEFLVDPIAVEGLVSEQVLEIDAINEWRHTNCVKTVAGQQDEADQIAQRISQCEDFGRPAAFRFADGLILGPPFAPCP